MAVLSMLHVCFQISFYSWLLFSMYNSQYGIIQTLASSLSQAPSVVSEQDLCYSTSPSYSPVSWFVQLYLFQLLPTALLRGSCPMSTVRRLTLLDKTGWVPCRPSLWPVYMSHLVVSIGMWLNQSF